MAETPEERKKRQEALIENQRASGDAEGIQGPGLTQRELGSLSRPIGLSPDLKETLILC